MNEKIQGLGGMPKQATPDMTKTLGDAIREALERETKRRDPTGAASSEQCDCPTCQAERAGAFGTEAMRQGAVPASADADLKIGSTVTNAKGNHITALFEEEGDTAVLSFSGRGVNFVATEDGDQGIRFNSPEALQEFFEFVAHVEAL